MSFRQTPPDLTREMEEAGQVWVWIYDEPTSVDFNFSEYVYRPGHWEVRGTGVVVEDRNTGR